MDSGTLTPWLGRLAQLGLLQRQRRSADDRRVRVQLTPPGRCLQARAMAVPQAVAWASGYDLAQLCRLAGELTALRRPLASPPSPAAVA